MENKYDIFFTHFFALIKKRLQYLSRDKKGITCEIVLPFVVIIIGLGLMSSPFLIQSPDLVYDTSVY